MRVILADENHKLLWALRSTLKMEAGVEIVGEVEDVGALQALAGTVHPDLILVDGKMLKGKAQPLIAQLQAHKPRPIVIVVSSSPEDSGIMLRAGADAFISKDEQPGWLLETLRYYKARCDQDTGSAPEIGSDKS